MTFFYNAWRCSPGLTQSLLCGHLWPQTGGSNPPASASWVLALQVWVTYSVTVVVSQFTFIFWPNGGHGANLELKVFCYSFPREAKVSFLSRWGVSGTEIMISGLKEDPKGSWPHFIGRRLHCVFIDGDIDFLKRKTKNVLRNVTVWKGEWLTFTHR